MGKKNILAAVACLVFGLCVCLNSWPADHYSQPIDLAGYTWADGVATGPEAALPPGTYSLGFGYWAGAPDIRVEVYSALYANEDNTPDLVLAQTTLEEGEGAVALEFNVDRMTRSVFIRFTPLAGEGDLYIEEGGGLQSRGAVYNDTLFFGLLFLLAAVALLLWPRLWARAGTLGGGRGQEIPPAWLLGWGAVVTLLACLPLLRGFLGHGHDLVFQLARVEGVYEGLVSGQFPVRINTVFANGAGYASPVLYPELFLYIPALLRLCGLSLLLSYQVLGVLLNLATLCLAYHCYKKLLGSALGSMVAASAYLLCTYRLNNLYLRGALGEALAMVFLPCIALGLYGLLAGDVKDAKWLTIGFTGLLGSHVISTQIALLFCAGAALCCLPRLLQKPRLLALCKQAALCLLLNLWFILPFLSFSRLNLAVFSDPSHIETHAVYPAQLFATFLRSEGLAGGLDSTADMPLGLGGLLGAGLLVFAAAWLRRCGKADEKPLLRTGAPALAAGGAALFAASVFFPWATLRKIPLLGDFLASAQYPWRYLGVGAAALSLVLAAGVCLLTLGSPQARRRACLACVAAACLVGGIYIDSYVQSEHPANHVSPPVTSKFDPLFHGVDEAFYLYGGQYFTRGTSLDGVLKTTKALTSPADIAISGYTQNGAALAFTYQASALAPGEDYVDTPLYYYPGYRAALADGARLAVAPNGGGMLRVQLPEGGGAVRVWYGGLWYFRLGDAASLATLLGLGGWALLKRRRGKQNRGKESAPVL